MPHKKTQRSKKSKQILSATDPKLPCPRGYLIVSPYLIALALLYTCDASIHLWTTGSGWSKGEKCSSNLNGSSLLLFSSFTFRSQDQYPQICLTAKMFKKPLSRWFVVVKLLVRWSGGAWVVLSRDWMRWDETLHSQFDFLSRWHTCTYRGIV